MIKNTSQSDIFIVHDLGDRNQVPFLFLHGFTGSSKSWSHIIRKLDHPYIIIDLPGHGKSRFSNLLGYTFNNWTSDLKQILDEIDIHTIKLCGYSMGGRLATAFTQAYPSIVKEIFIESSHMGIEDNEDRKKRLSDDIDLANKIRNEFSQFLSDWSAMDLFQMQKVRNINAWRAQEIIRSSHDSDQLAKALDSFSLGRMPIYHQFISKSDIPIHCINGAEDSKYLEYSKFLCELNNHIVHHIVDEASHNVHLENEQAYINILNNSPRYNIKKKS